MEQRERTGAEPQGGKVLLWIGFGLFLVTYGGGPLGFVSGSTAHDAPWEFLLLTQTAFFLGTLAGCWIVKSVAGQVLLRQREMLGALAYLAATLLGLAIQPVLASVDVQAGIAARGLLSLIAGVFYAQPLLFWVEQLLGLSRTAGRFGFFAVLVPCYLLNPLIMAVVSRLEGVPFVLSFAMALCALAAAVLQIVRAREGEAPAVPGRSDALPEADRPYRLSVHSAAVLLCLGFSWGVAEAACLLVFGGDGSSETILSLAITFSLVLAVALALWAFRGQSGLRFGAFIRLTLVACGAVLVTLPLLVASAPWLLFPLCNFVMIVGEISLIVFALDLCNEERQGLTGVFTVNYTVFVGASTASAALFWLVQTAVGGATAWWLVSVVCTWVVLGVIPVLPSRASDAVVFTLDSLPENEGYEARVTLQRERFAQRYGLSDGEAEVLGYLLQGMKREQIAAEMYLSPWTIKARTSAIYKKCGIHSYKELMKLMAGDES